MVTAWLLVFFSCCTAASAPAPQAPATPILAPSGVSQPAMNASAPVLSGVETMVPVQFLASAKANTTDSQKGKAPCQCVSNDSSWVQTPRTTPKCIFVDLGAADGNTFRSFLNDGFGPVANCPSGGQWEAFLVEANPRFNAPLQELAARYPGSVHAMSSTAAYMCQAQTSFFLDTANVGQNYWGSSMSSSHPDAQKSGLQKVTVPTANINRILAENTIPGDWVMLKMDIEGSEWDVMPCIAAAPASSLIDRFYIETHSNSWSLSGTTTPAMYEAAKAQLRKKGVDIPNYFSQTF